MEHVAHAALGFGKLPQVEQFDFITLVVGFASEGTSEPPPSWQIHQRFGSTVLRRGPPETFGPFSVLGFFDAIVRIDPSQVGV
jgi:hypothetical protein